MKRAVVLSGMVLVCGVAIASAPTLPPGPSNTDCTLALHFCDDLDLPINPEWDYSGCLWFTTEITYAQAVDLTISAPGALIAWYGPPQDCSSLPSCSPDGLWAEDELAIQQVFPPGTYLIAVSVLSGGDTEEIEIDLQQGTLCSSVPVNTDCEHAIPLCEDLSTLVDMRERMCLWYSFTVYETEHVVLDIDCDCDEVMVHGRFDPQHPCPDEPRIDCGSHGNYVLDSPDLVFDEELEPGLYYITALVDPEESPTLDIDVVEGLGCEMPPPNAGCDGAVPFCSDLEFAIDPAWATLGVKCLWFTFTLTEPTYVDLGVISQGSAVSIYGPAPPGVPCERYFPTLCGNSTPIYSGLSPVEFAGNLQAGTYFVNVKIGIETPGPIIFDVEDGIECLPCENCLPAFALLPKKDYVISAWTRVTGLPSTTIHYDTPRIRVESPVGTLIGFFKPTGVIIDGWQRIEGVFHTPGPITSFKLELLVTSGTAFFDDVRVFPADGSMKCYVYDPENLRFVAELDERHYATFYEYDGEGKLTRTKKETERGIMTIQETRYNSSDKSSNP